MKKPIEIARTIYLDALESSGADWRAVAEKMFSCLPAPKVPPTASDARFTPWFSKPRAFYAKKNMKDWRYMLTEITFADGVKIRSYAIAAPVGPFDVGTAARAAYQKRAFRNLPDCREIVALRLIDDTSTYDPAAASAELRAFAENNR